MTKSVENSVTTPKTNIGSTSQKCPEMTQLMLEDRKLGHKCLAELLSFGQIDGLNGFQLKDNETFGSVLDRKRQLKPRKGPEYRRINTYFKTTKQYWKERNRRKKAWQLWQNHTQEQIAEILGVNIKTVQRDLKKVKPYHYRMIRHHFNELGAERQQRLDAELEGKSPGERLNIITNRLIEHRNLMKAREYNRHHMIVTIDMTNMTYGIPEIKTSFKNGTVTYPFKIRFHVKTEDFEHDVGGLRIG